MLRQKLPRDARPAGAECRSHGELTLPGANARHEQTGHVGSRDEEYEHDRPEKDDQCALDLLACLLRHGPEAVVEFQVGRVLLQERLHHRAQLVLRRESCSRITQSADDGQILHRVVPHVGRIEYEWDPYFGAKPEAKGRGQLRASWKRKSPRHDGGDCEGLSVESDLFSDDAGIGSEAALPHIMAEYRDIRRAGPRMIR